MLHQYQNLNYLCFACSSFSSACSQRLITSKLGPNLSIVPMIRFELSYYVSELEIGISLLMLEYCYLDYIWAQSVKGRFMLWVNLYELQEHVLQKLGRPLQGILRNCHSSNCERYVAHLGGRIGMLTTCQIFWPLSYTYSTVVCVDTLNT